MPPSPDPDRDERDDDHLEEIDAEVVELFPAAEMVRADADVIDADYDEPALLEVDHHDDPRPQSWLAARAGTVADRPILPRPEQVWASTRWWSRVLTRDLGWCLTHPHRVLLAELRPIWRGVVVSWQAWRRWETEADYAARLGVTATGAPGASGAAKDLAHMQSGHRRVSVATAVIVLAGLAVVWWLWPTWLLAPALVALLVLDLVGRGNPHPDAAPPPTRRTLLEEGAPLGALAAQIVNRLVEDGVRAAAAGPMTVHAGGEYRIDVVHEDEIGPKHLRSLERHLAARPTSIRMIGTDDSGTSQLRLPTRDHLARVPQRPWCPTGSRSIADPAPLWVRSDGDPSMPILAGIHLDAVGTTGSGKTEFFQELISHSGECRDDYPVFGDLTMGPIGPLNKNVLRRVAYTVEDLDALLDWVLARIDERHMILHRLAESDDDDAPTEWDLSWGAQISVYLDEYSFVAEHEELHAKVEKGMRVGRKVKVVFRRASQRSGNKDLGSTVAQALVGLRVLLACTERDTTTMLSTTHRDRGWTPHEFKPAVPGDTRDAGKCMVSGPAHRDPEIHRVHAPLEPGEVKRRDRQRAADGLPNLDGTPPGEHPAVLLSDVQAAVERVFAERDQPWLPTQMLVDDLAARGLLVKPGALADQLGNCGSREPWGDKAQVRGYRLTDVHEAWGVGS